MISDLQVERLIYWARKHRAVLAAGIAHGSNCTIDAARELAAVERLLHEVAPPEPPGIRNSRGHVD